ncbi:MAG: lytic transglycosylase domain-containing protein [Planctomycetes bacterium]|nr:lytic transglycosylase domain-containing protein [Planctomycetota bacterium]
MSRRAGLIVVLCLVAQAVAAQAAAELVFFSSGRSLSVKGHRDEGTTIVLILRGGGEVTCDASLVTRIAPDEVPYPEPTAPADTASFTAPAEVPYAEIIERASAQHGVDPGLVRAVIEVESAYQPGARSPKGAMGLMQLMPETARQYAVGNPYDPESNIVAGTRHLRSLLDRFDLSLALAAYNAGVAAVEKFRGVPPYAETRDYVKRVLQLASPRLLR